MFPEMRSVLVGGLSVKFHSQVAYFSVCISLSAFGVGHVLSVQPWSLDGNYLGFFFFLSWFSYSFLRGAITEAFTSNFAWIKLSLKKKKSEKKICWKHGGSYLMPKKRN